MNLDHTCKTCQVIHAAACPLDRADEQGEALLRVAKELRQWIADAPPDDREAMSLLQDCSELEEAGDYLKRSRWIVFGAT